MQAGRIPELNEDTARSTWRGNKKQLGHRSARTTWRRTAQLYQVAVETADY